MAVWGVTVWGEDVWGLSGTDADPTVTPVSPVHLQTNFPNNGNIELIIDDDNSVDLSTVMVRFDLGDGAGYVTVMEGYGSPQFKSGWDGPGSSVTTYGNGYRIIVDPVDSLPSGSISIEVTASDNAGNEL